MQETLILLHANSKGVDQLFTLLESRITKLTTVKPVLNSHSQKDQKWFSILIIA